jgi:hypothetical protein
VDVEAVQTFARDFYGDRRGKWINVDWLDAFCLFVRRAVLHGVDKELNKWPDLSVLDTF